MDKKQLFEHCYKEYCRAADEVESVYRRCAFLLTAIIVMGGALASLTELSWFTEMFGRVDRFLYASAMLVSLTALGYASVFVWRAALPRKYQKLVPIGVLCNWRADLEKHHRASGSENSGTLVDDASLDLLIERACEAQQLFSEINGSRFGACEKSIRALGFALAGLGLSFIIHQIIALQGAL